MGDCYQNNLLSNMKDHGIILIDTEGEIIEFKTMSQARQFLLDYADGEELISIDI